MEQQEKTNDQKISIVIPAFNEQGSIKRLYDEIEQVMRALGAPYEIIFVNDGSTDGTGEELARIYQSRPENSKVVELRRNFGKAAALDAGFGLATGGIIITMDADGQDDPGEIERLIEELRRGYDLVSGWKTGRKDGPVKNWSSRFFNLITRLFSGVRLHDFNCGFKAYNSEAAKSLELYGELHRYIPVMLAAQGFKISEIKVKHRARLSGRSKYGPARFFHGLFDLATVMFLVRYRVRPLHLFGYLGVACFSLGFIFGAYLSFERLVLDQKIGDRPLLLLSAMLLIMGVQIGIFGLIAELITNMAGKNAGSTRIRKILK